MVFENSLLQQIGIYQYSLIETKQIIFLNEVRSLCEGNICGMYGTTGLARSANIKYINGENTVVIKI